MCLTAALAVQVSGCGLILYPERRGQTRGDIDPAVAILDGVGLLFFILPGVIAFVVDFHHGTIYLPEGGKKGDDSSRDVDPRREPPDLARWTAVPVGPGRLDAETLRDVVARNTGHRIDLDDPRLEVSELPPACAAR